MTLSIAAWDESTGQLGAAISSSSISVSSRCLHWRPRVGIALSQNITDPRLGPRMLGLLEDGVEVPAAIEAVVQSTPYINFRQLGLIDCRGNTGVLPVTPCSDASLPPRGGIASPPATCWLMRAYPLRW